jgi:hypothetical protein
MNDHQIVFVILIYIFSKKNKNILLKKTKTVFNIFCFTISTSYISKFPSFEPVASLVPSGENLQNHTSSV